MATKKGIALLPVQVNTLIECANGLSNEADKAFMEMPDNSKAEYSVHLGYGTYITVKQYNNSRFYDIRRFWKPSTDDEPTHTKTGLMLSSEEFDKFKSSISLLLASLPVIKEVQACDCMFMANQLGFLQCARCNPWDFMNW